MMRSLYSGVSGLQNHQVRMDVIGNNISNVNTTGYRRGRVNFQDLISQNMRGAARPGIERGGVNPQQVGLGMNVASIDTLHLQGSLQTTGKRDDLAIQGDGFFVLSDGDRNLYTRAGAFGLDANGTLVNPGNGMRVLGWAAEDIDGTTMINTTGNPGELNIPIGGKDGAQETTEVRFASNLNRNTPLIPENATASETAEGTWSVTQEIYDSFGTTHELRLDFTRVPGQPNQWQVAVVMNPGGDEQPLQNLSVAGVDSADTERFFVEFANDGTLRRVFNDEGGEDTDGELTVGMTFEVPESAIPIDPDTGLPEVDGVQTQTFTLNLGEAGSFTNAMTQFSSASSLRIFEQNGYGMGYLEDFRIDQSGTVTGIFSNGTNRALGQIALASFTNPGGLERVGDTNFARTINSGQADLAPAGSAGRGMIVSGALEMSNVDLSEAFTDMIVTQRGFQANSRTIRTADQMLQEVLTLKQ
ncbi:MAG: flagellar hook protein FlgE [Spirochaetaceae bacterium]|nr:MAG: flagellar hook protein FlgE [Spirochaetaceae bacterium]